MLNRILLNALLGLILIGAAPVLGADTAAPAAAAPAAANVAPAPATPSPAAAAAPVAPAHAPVVVTVPAETTAQRGYAMPPAASNHVDRIDGLMDFINIVTVVFFVIIIVLMVYFAIKFRRRDPAQRALSQMSHSTGLELGWTLPPLVIVIACFIWGFKGYLEMNTMPDLANAYVVDVVAQQFEWSFTHPNGRTEIGVLNIPVNRKIVLRTTSNDVIHSLFIPDFRVKKDVVRGRFNYLWFEALGTTPGADETMADASIDSLAKAAIDNAVRGSLIDTAQKAGKPLPTEAEIAAEAGKQYAALKPEEKKAKAQAEFDSRTAEKGHLLFCAEMCGTGHSLMTRHVVVHQPDWLPAAPKIGGADWEIGKSLFTSKGCVACHMPAGAPTIPCPPFTNGIWGKKEKATVGIAGAPIDVVVDEAYVKESIQQPLAKIVVGYQPLMPPLPVTDQEINYIIAYMKHDLPVKP